MTLEMREREIGRMWEKKGFARGEAVGQKRGQKLGEEIGRRKGEEIGRRQGEEIGRRQGEEIGQATAKEHAFLNALKNGVDARLAQKIAAISDETAERLLKAFQNTGQDN